MKNFSFLIFFACICSLLASCNLPLIGNTQPVDGYMRTASDSIHFYRWTEANGIISGTWTIGIVQNGKSQFLSGHLSGIHNGEQISLTLDGVPGAKATASGTIKDRVITLQAPRDDGSIETVTYQAVTLEEYNAALTDFKKKYPETK